MTAWLFGPVAMRSPTLTGVPTFAGTPFTVAVPSRRFTAEGMGLSPAARARER
jgi:hypothetical protein